MLPAAAKAPLTSHLAEVKRQHERDLAHGLRSASRRPYALASEVSERRGRLGRGSSRFPASPRLPRRPVGTAIAISPARVGGAACRGSGHPTGWNPEARRLPYVQAFVCHAFARRRVRHSHSPRAPWPCRCQHDDDLHACPQSRCIGRAQSCRSSVIGRGARRLCASART